MLLQVVSSILRIMSKSSIEKEKIQMKEVIKEYGSMGIAILGTLSVLFLFGNLLFVKGGLLFQLLSVYGNSGC